MSLNEIKCSSSEFLSYFIDENDKICIGYVTKIDPENRVSDADKFQGEKDKYFTPNTFETHRKNEDIVKINACFNDLDFIDEAGERDPDKALKEAPQVIERLREKGLYYAVEYSGRGLQSIVPVNCPDINTWKKWNWLVNYGWFEGYPIDDNIAKIPCSYLRLPNTINSKSGRLAHVLYHNFDSSVDMKAHNATILTKYWEEFESSKANMEEEESSQKLDRGIIDYRTNYFEPDLLRHMAQCDWEIVHSMNFVKTEGRVLHRDLLPNLAAYAKIFNKKTDVVNFIEAIDGDVKNFERWLAIENVNINYSQLRMWAKKHFPNTKVEALAEADWDKFQFSNAYYKIYTQEAHLHFDSLGKLRDELNVHMESKLLESGVHFIFAEMGAGKTYTAEKWAESGKNVLMLVPYTSLRINLPMTQNLYCFTFDTLVPKSRSKAGVKNLKSLLAILRDCDVICIDEAHTLDTLYQLKPKVIDAVRQLMQNYRYKLPIFLLSGTPSVNQISGSKRAEFDSFKTFLLKRERKPLTLVTVDKRNCMEFIQEHDRVLFFVDNVSDIRSIYAFIKSTKGLSHKILQVTSLNNTDEKIELQEEIKKLDKFIVIASSAFSSGLNIPLDTVVLCNRIVTHQSLHQVINRLRIACKPDQENRIYYLNHAPFKMNSKSKGACDLKGDLMVAVSKKLLIKQLGKVYNLTTIDMDFKRMRGLSEFMSIPILMNCIKQTQNIYAFCREFNIFEIPWEVFTKLKSEGFDLDTWYVTHTFEDAKRTKSNTEFMLEKGFIKRRMKLTLNGESKAIWAYCHLLATMESLNGKPDPKEAMKKLKLKTPIRGLFKINKMGQFELDLLAA